MSISSRNKPKAEFSMASFADIVFMLLIYFMLTSTFVAQVGLKVNLPQSSSEKPSLGKNAVTIAEDLKFAWNEKEVEKEDLQALIEDVLTDDTPENDVITIRVDKKVLMEEATYVMAIVAKYGGEIHIATEKE